MEEFGFVNEVKYEYGVRRILYYPVVQKQNMVQRGYQINATAKNIMNLSNAVDRFGENIKSTHIAETVPDFYTLGTRPDISVNITNGWNTRRFGFVYVLDVVKRENGSITGQFVNIIEGYTETSGHFVGNDGKLYPDPNMTHYINRIYRYGNKLLHTHEGTKQIAEPPQAFNIIKDRISGGGVRFEEDRMTLKTLRPIDIPVNIYTKTKYDVDITDYSSDVSTSINESAVTNQNPANFVSAVMSTAYRSSTNLRASSINPNAGRINETDLYAGMMSTVGEHNLSSIEFINTLSESFGFISGEFTINNLTSFIFGMKEKTVVIDPKKLTGVRRVDAQSPEANALTTNDPETLAKANESARVATIFTEALGPIMDGLKVYKMAFSITTVGGYKLKVLDAPSNPFFKFTQEGLMKTLNDLNILIKSQILPLITKRGEQHLELLCNYDKLTESRVGIKIYDMAETSRLTIFAFPTFASSLYDPVIIRGDRLDKQISEWKTATDLVL